MKTMLLFLAILTLGLPARPAVNATEPTRVSTNAHYRHFLVQYRTSPHDLCLIAGPYECFHDAQHAAANLRSQGFIVDWIVTR